MMLFKCFIISIIPLIFNRKLPFQSRSSGTELCHTFTTTYTFKLLHQFQGFQRVKFIHAISVSDLNARTLPRLPPFPQCLKENRKKLHLYTRFFQPVHHLFSHCRPRDSTLQNCLFKLSSYARAYLYRNYVKTKGKFNWDNKTCKITSQTLTFFL